MTRRKKNKKPIWFKISIGILSVLVILFAIGSGGFYLLFNKMDTIDLNKENLAVTPKEELEIYDSATCC